MFKIGLRGLEETTSAPKVRLKNLNILLLPNTAHTLRPHYHGIVFGVSLKDFQRYALSDWEEKFGFTTSRSINIVTDYKERDKNLNNTLRYVAKYCMKGEEFENPFVLSGEAYPNFHLISKGIGQVYINNFKKYVLNEDYTPYSPSHIAYLAEVSKVKIGTCEYPFPRYFKLKLYDKKTYLSFKVSNYLRQKHDDVYLSQFREVQAKRNWTDIQTIRYLDMQASCTKRIETEKKLTNLSKFYNKSKF